MVFSDETGSRAPIHLAAAVMPAADVAAMGVDLLSDQREVPL